MKISSFLKSSFAWLAKLFTEVPIMTDESIAVAAPAPAAALAAFASAAAPAVATPALPAVNTDTLKALLLTLGHDIEADWDHLVALVRKAI